MCSPDFFNIKHEINAWMKKQDQPDMNLARRQWLNLVQHYINIGLDVYFIAPDRHSQDMCFAANAAWCRWGKIIISNFIGKAEKARSVERYDYYKWFLDRNAHDRNSGLNIFHFPEPDIAFEGQGDVVTVDVERQKSNALILTGYGQGRSHKKAGYILGDIHELRRDQVIPVKLINHKFYHLDTACVFILPATFLYYQKAFDERGLNNIKSLPVDKISVSDEDAYNFVCNGFFAKNSETTFFLVNKISARLKAILNEIGIKVIETSTSEFMKSGGSVRCLTLVLENNC